MKNPHHRAAWPRVLTCLNPTNPMPAAQRVVDRFENVWATHGGKAWLFIDGALQVRVFNDNQTSLQRWLRVNPEQLVGCYTKNGGVIVEGVACDMQMHYIQLLLGGLIVQQNEATSAI